MLAHLQITYPWEGCGLLAGTDGEVSHLYAIDNRLHSPVEFEMDPGQQLAAMLHIEQLGIDLLATYHSHPQGPQVPSPTDIARAYYPELAHIIVSLQERAAPRVRGFMIQDDIVQEIMLTVAE